MRNQKNIARESKTINVINDNQRNSLEIQGNRKPIEADQQNSKQITRKSKELHRKSTRINVEHQIFAKATQRQWNKYETMGNQRTSKLIERTSMDTQGNRMMRKEIKVLGRPQKADDD